MTLSATLVIIGITVLCHLLTQQNPILKSKMLFNAFQIKHRNEWWRWISHALIHADLSHLAINMFVLWMFGSVVEEKFGLYFEEKGLPYFLLLYIGGVLVSSLPSFFKHQDNPSYNALGASGATSSMLFAYILIYPTRPFYYVIPAFVFGIVYLWYEHKQGQRGRTGIAHDAHFWGAVFGFVGLLAMRPALFPEFIAQIRMLLTSFLP